MSIRDIKECWEYLPQIVETMHSGLMPINPEGIDPRPHGSKGLRVPRFGIESGSTILRLSR